jgi:CheY-like chemotaxis protein
MSLRVLVVEDSPMNRLLVRDLLELRGHEVLSASSAVDLGSVEAMPRPDIVLLDIMLPGVDGITLRRQLAVTPGWEAVPFVAVTAYAMSGDRERLLQEGFVAYVAKPIDTRRFAALVEEVAAASPPDRG